VRLDRRWAQTKGNGVDSPEDAIPCTPAGRSTGGGLRPEPQAVWSYLRVCSPRDTAQVVIQKMPRGVSNRPASGPSGHFCPVDQLVALRHTIQMHPVCHDLDMLCLIFI
jgi:hypothetical protein